MTPLVFVHGFMGGSNQWAAQKPLAESREIITLDLPGFGKNSSADTLDSIPAFAEWVLESLDARGIDDFDLLGHSMGGMVVQEIAHLAPDRLRKLVLYSTGSIGVLPGRFEPIETSMERAKSDGAEATARRIAATWFLQREKAAAYPACADVAAQASLKAILAGLQAMQGWSGADRLGHIRAETLVLWSDGDRTYPWSQIELLWQSINGAQLAVIPGCAHAVHMEKPELFNAVLSDFLEGADGND